MIRDTDNPYLVMVVWYHDGHAKVVACEPNTYRARLDMHDAARDALELHDVRSITIEKSTDRAHVPADYIH